MRFVIVGAGAVGALVGAQLARAGHEVSFWVRPNQRRERARLKIESVEQGSGARPAYEIEARFLSDGDAPPAHDWVFVCVRGEQLEATLEQIAAQLGVHSNVVISTVSFDSARSCARRHGLQGQVLAHHVSFGVHRDPHDPEHFLWFPFDAPSIVSADGDRASFAAARTLADALRHSGLRTTPMLSVRHYMTFMMGLSAPFLAAWDACDFQLERLARDSELRRLTAKAMVEAPRGLPLRGPSRLLRLLPAAFWSCVLRVLPRVIKTNGREVWLHHGPKIREQTRYCLAFLQQQTHDPTPALRALAQRFELRFQPSKHETR